MDMLNSSLNNACKLFRNALNSSFGRVATNLNGNPEDQENGPNIFGALDDARIQRKAKINNRKIRIWEPQQKVENNNDITIERGPFFDYVSEAAAMELAVETITVHGEDKPSTREPTEQLPRLESFYARQNLDVQLRLGIKAKDYGQPTIIQAVSIPYFLQTDTNMLVRSETGSGKTASYLIPLIEKVLELKMRQKTKLPNADSPYALVISPTRELAAQIIKDAQIFAQHTKVKVARAIGEENIHDTTKLLKNGCDIVVGTQGRIVHYFFGTDTRNTFKCLKFDNLAYLVIDEVDRALRDDNFYMMIRKITTQLEKINRTCRIIMFSATVEDFRVDEFLKPKYIQITLGGLCHPSPTIIQSFLDVGSKISVRNRMLLGLLDLMITVDENDRYPTARRVPSTVIFVKTKRFADRLAIVLIQKGFRAFPINGDRSMELRQKAVRRLKTRDIDILVATDVVSRGLNIPNVELVINFDLPEREYSEYIHRIGRTGRLGNIGRAVSFFDSKSDEQIAPFLESSLEHVGQRVPMFIRIAAERVRNNERILSGYAPDPNCRRPVTRSMGGKRRSPSKPSLMGKRSR